MLAPMYIDWLVGELGVRVTHDWPTGERWGEYEDSTRTIRLRPDLGVVQRRSTLAHECGHAYYRHRGVTPRQERQAREFGALFLIRMCDLLKAAQCCERSRDIAMELGVLPSDVETYLRLLKQK